MSKGRQSESGREDAASSRSSRRRDPADSSRRDFLVKFCQEASAAFIPAGLRGLAFPFAYASNSANLPSCSNDFHLHPHYRAQLPLEATLLKTQAGLDEFVTEKYHDQIAAILPEWRACLLRSPQDVRRVEKILALDFSGSSFRPVESRLVHSGPAVEVRQNKFAGEPALARDAFLRDLQSAMDSFLAVITAEFQVTSIDTESSTISTSGFPSRLLTRARYELVGSGKDFDREQRVGCWDLEWESSAADEFRLRSWLCLMKPGAVLPRLSSPTLRPPGFAGNASYSSQLLRGADYWRTVLDVACGIDIYGHNGVSVGDIDGDGFDDLYVCQPAGLPNRLYRNRGDGTFEDITEVSGVGLLENTACALFADFDNDGRQDLVVVRTSGRESGRRQVSPKARRFSLRQSSSRNFYGRGRGRV